MTSINSESRQVYTFNPKPRPHPLTQTEQEQVQSALAILQTRLRGDRMNLTNPQLVRDYLTLSETFDNREHFKALWLDTQLGLITTQTLATGTLNQASVYPREVVRAALEHGAAAVILTHNHPSGLADPSSADINLTLTLKQALALVDVRLIDHVVTALGTSCSMAELGRI